MLLYKTRNGILIERDNRFYAPENSDWDSFLNDDHLFENLQSITSRLTPVNKSDVFNELELLPPIGQQEVWACGVTYY
ncbi:2-hydroxyhepta-2,4-diene-1,7-dioate isomerase, partial [Fulvivirgaceae bacterium PWU20]|nr:2-hydroxyhepta-2,4-diene-1,7-dioate isomerase [Chryseosolibacter indicus]